MRTASRWAVLALASSAGALCQQVAFTTRNLLDCPVEISSFAGSKAYGFESVVLRNEGDRTLAAVYLQVAFRNGPEDEVVEERRVDVEIEPHGSKRANADLGHAEGLRLKAKSAREEKTLAILSVKRVEFTDGTGWESKGPVEGVPIEPEKK